MAYLTVNITIAADGPFNAATLFGGGTITGATLTPATPAKPPRIANQLIIAAAPGNGANLIYIGTDASLLPTSGGGTGIVLSATSQPLVLTDIDLAGVYISASANTTSFSMIAQGGFQ
jgi:hypothetical protein